MNGQGPKQWGLFPPLSQALPTDKQLIQNDSMIEELKRNNNFEAPEETEKRTEVLKTFQKTCVEFIKLVGKKKGMTDKQVKDLGGKVATFGSFRLGVFGPGSDIDALVIAPKHVTRDDFFEQFPSMLEKMSPTGAIEEMKPVPDAYVPIIKLEYSGISIDLIFARLQQSTIPFTIDMKDDSLLRGLDEVELRCVNGVRVSDMITSLVPQLKTFRSTLRTIKLWAQRRAIYGNVFGFPGGVAWAMMVASVCQSYPQACASVVVGKFFHLISTWSWPRPILLKQIDENPVGMSQKVWNPMIYRGDKNHLMPVITPAYPSMCSTHNITRSTQKIILNELRRAEDITRQVHDGKQAWSDLFSRNTFFTKDFKYYLCVVSASKTKEAQAVWSGLIESKVRRLVAGIEDSQAGISLARPFVKAFHRVHRADDEEQVSEILQGKMSYLVTDSKSTNESVADGAVHEAAIQAASENVQAPNGTSEVIDDTKEEQKPKMASTIYTTTYYIGIDLSEGSKSSDVSFAVGDFIRQCNMWPQYDADMNSVKVVHIRNYALPDDVFQEGEVRPSRPPKKGKPVAASTESMKKRSFSNSNMEGSFDSDAKRRQPSTVTAGT